MSENALYPRLALARLETVLADTPVVLIHGPRQCGKSTLARTAAAQHGHTYFTFDDPELLRTAREDPAGFCAELPEKTILDEVQRVPELFMSIKALVDRDRRPGRMILTGSANVLLMPRLSDSLAGRMETVRLSPLAQREIERSVSGAGFLDRLFANRWGISRGRRVGIELVERMLAGGFPAALARPDPARRREWQLAYVDGVTQREILELTSVRSLQTVPRLMELAASQTARLFNASELAAPFELSRPTVLEHLALLERLFLIDLLPPWSDNRLSRLVKTPKLHLADTGLAGALLGVDVQSLFANRGLLGQLLETFVYQELRRQGPSPEASYRFFHYRDKDQVEVDVLVERNGRDLAGVEVKASSTPSAADFRGLRRIQAAAGDRFKAGIVLYDGESALPFGDRMHAVPFAALWQNATPPEGSAMSLHEVAGAEYSRKPAAGLALGPNPGLSPAYLAKSGEILPISTVGPKNLGLRPKTWTSKRAATRAKTSRTRVRKP